MAGPFRPSDRLGSPASNSPLSPPGGSGTPVSFRTNVNRAKTKRWVEAKKYSYDGNEWGDDDYDEYDNHEEEPASQWPEQHHMAGDAPSAASRSIDGNAAAKGPEGSVGSQDSKPLPFIRPADIYQRMRAERQQSQSDSSANVASPSANPAHQSVPSATVPGHETSSGTGVQELYEPLESKADSSDSTPTATQDVPTINLPEVKRMSIFDPNFLGEPGSNKESNQSAEPQQSELQHNPSLGFRSAVHQAFDVPETPDSATDSVLRSNSASTSGISPIMEKRGFDDDIPPTIVEEPDESTPKQEQSSGRNSIVFKPGHRRDLSVPSPGNSPSRKPVVTDNEQAATSALAEMSSISPSDSPAKEMPPPLRVTSPTAIDPNASYPVIIPSMSTETSPEDTENDRLRREIMRSLTPSDEPEPQDGSRPQTRREDSLVPSEYERYWDDEANLTPHDQPRHSVPEINSPQVALQDSPSIPAASELTEQSSRPKLKKRFSWESSTSSSEAPAPAADLNSPAALATVSSAQPPLSYDDMARSGTDAGPYDAGDSSMLASERGEPDHPPATEKPKLTILTPSAADSNGHVPEVTHIPAAQDSGAGASSALNTGQAWSAAPAIVPSSESTLLGFRDILGIQSSDERMRAFSRTREQFSTIDTGLSKWIQLTVHSHPEHTDVVDQSLKPLSDVPKLAASKSKFPKLPSLGNLTSHQDGNSPAGHGHVRRSSGALGGMKNMPQVELRGKELLHTAGVFGGKAGEAAKGLFSRGRNKWKAGGGNDKDLPSPRGPTSPTKESREDSVQRPSAPFRGLPLVNTSRHRDDPTRLSPDPKLNLVPRVSEGRESKSEGAIVVQDAESNIKLEDTIDHNPPRSDVSLGQDNWADSRTALRSGPPSDADQIRWTTNTKTPGETCETEISPPEGTAEIVESLQVPPEQPNISPILSTQSSHSAMRHSDGPTPESTFDPNSPKARDFQAESSDGSSYARRMERSSVPLALRQIPSISSLGAQDAAVIGRQYQSLSLLGGLAHETNSIVSLPSDHNSDAAHQRNRSGLPGAMDDTVAPGPSGASISESLRSWSGRGGEDQDPLGHGTVRSRSIRTRSSLNDLLSQPNSDSLQSAFSSTRANAASSEPDLTVWGPWDEPSSPPHKSQAALRKLKKVGRLPQFSHKRAFSRFSGLFGRSQTQPQPTINIINTRPPRVSHQHHLQSSASIPSPPTFIQQLSPSEHHHHPSPNSPASFRGQPPPLQGYYAPDPSTSNTPDIGSTLPVQPGQRMSNQQRSNSISKEPISDTTTTTGPSSSTMSPDCQLYYGGYYQQAYPQQPSPKLLPPYQSTPSPLPPRTPPSRSSEPARGRSTGRTYAQDLHLRSRSPKSFPPFPEEKAIPSSDLTDPAYHLGMFRSNPRTSRLGDQELPWKITIPGSDDEDDEHGYHTPSKRATGSVRGASSISSMSRPRDGPGRGGHMMMMHPVAEDPGHPERGHGRMVNATRSPIELPTGGEDASEEIVMSSTAYPGQEWRPDGLSGWEYF